ncbi:MAG TPA: protein kinase, partial [Verrucomicrobiae bacterium]
MKGFFGNLFGKQPEPEKNEKRLEPPKRDVPKRAESELYKKGDVIGGKYEVLGSLGKGGFGLVYLVYTRDVGEVCALKTFRDELINNVASREAFKKEASLWINLKSHPCILEAWWVDEVSGRLFVAMECITPDEQQRVTLADHLKGIRLEKVQVLEWAIQFCLGMEHAKAQGIECHRDIKPPNILISPKRVLKISDFGLSLATEAAWRVANHKPDISTNGNTNGHQSLHLIQNEGKQICGTPGYIAPEILRGAGASVRSDIYSFGLVLWQMTSGSPTPPFMPKWPGRMDAFLAEIYRLQTTSAAPPVENQIDEIIARCLKPAPEARYRNFGELCNALEPLLLKQTGRKIEIRELEHGKGTALNNRAYSFAALGRSAEAKKCYEEVIVYFDKVLAKNPKD